MLRALFFTLCLSLPAAAQTPDVADLAPREGWAVHPTQMGFDALVAAVRDAAGQAGLGVVTEAGPTGVAAGRGIDIPGNRVIGLFNNDVAIRLLDASTHAMIEAPIRVYVTENADGTATLSYVRPSVRLAPYDAPGVAAIAAELDTVFAQVARIATTR